jgi:cell wall assembly regulator SMI1
MMKLAPFEAIDKSTLASFESKLGIMLPDAYRRFLLKSNGGRPDPAYFDVPSWPDGGISVGDFFGIRSQRAANLQFWIDEAGNELLPDFIPVADDPGGNLLCLRLTEPDRGAIYYWDASPDRDLDETTGTMFKVAESIDEFLKRLRPPD